MRNKRYLNLPFCGLALYLLVISLSGFIYVGAQQEPGALKLNGVSVVALDSETVELSVRGNNLRSKVQASLAFDAANRHAIVGSLPVWGQAIDVQVVRDKLYVVTLNEGVRAYDLAVPLAPETAGISFGVRPWKINADEDRIYLSGMARGISVYDARNKDMLYQIDSRGHSFSSTHRGRHLFVADGKAGLRIYDVSDIKKPKVLSSLSLPGNTVELALLGKYLLATSSNGGLNLVDISDVGHPRLLQTVKARKRYEKVTIVGNAIYASDNDQSLDVFSLSNNHRLERVASVPLYGRVRGFAIDKEQLYVSESAHGVTLFDVSDPMNPQRKGYVGTPGEAQGLAVYGDYLYVASNSQGVQIIDTRLFIPRTFPALDTPGDAQDLLLDGRWLYLAAGRAGLQVIDRLDNSQMELVSSVKTDSYAKLLVKSGDMLFVAVARGDILVFDVHTPTEPRLISRLQTGDRISDMALRGNELFTSSVASKLLRIDISDPWHPWITETLDLPGKGLRVAVKDDDVYIATQYAGLLVARFEPGLPGKLIAQLSRPWPMSEFANSQGIAIRGDFAYLVQGTEGLQIIDIGEPSRPVEVALVRIPGQSLNIILSEKYAIISTRWSGYYFVDIQHPGKAVLAANIFYPRVNRGFKVEGDRLYSLGIRSGISVLPLPGKAIGRDYKSDLALKFSKPTQAGRYDLFVNDGTDLVREPAVLEVD